MKDMEQMDKVKVKEYIEDMDDISGFGEHLGSGGKGGHGENGICGGHAELREL